MASVMTRALVLAVLWLLAAAGAQAAPRVALLIGNATYSSADFALRNPVNDVRAVGERLALLGFAVTVLENADRATMAAALDRFGRDIAGAETAFFYFAGHGMQVEGENLLLGSDLPALTATALRAAALTLSDVKTAIEAARPGIGIVVLDACRNNPLSARGSDVLDGPGLRREAGGAGLLVAYATDPGNVAYDGAGRNSVFTSAFLRHMEAPALDVRLMFGRVRQEVVVATGGRQVPWVEEAVIGEHALNTSISQADIVALTDRDVERWREVSGTIRPEPYRDYLRDFPDGLFREFAEQRLARFSMTPAQNIAQGQESKDFDLAKAVAQADAPKLTAALATLGYITRSVGAAEPALLRQGLEAYVAQLGSAAAWDERALYVEAARLTVFLGTKLAQRIRTDIVALQSIDKAETVARAAYDEIAALAKTSKDAEALLPVARLDLDAIAEAKATVLDRLDQSREYYDQLIQSAGTHFGDLMTPALMGLEDGKRSLSAIEQAAERDIRLFLKHARLGADEKTRGTLSWLSDYLPRA
jgi:hypothetical protein